MDVLIVVLVLVETVKFLKIYLNKKFLLKY